MHTSKHILLSIAKRAHYPYLCFTDKNDRIALPSSGRLTYTSPPHYSIGMRLDALPDKKLTTYFGSN